MPVKIATATKQLALQKIRDGLSVKEIAELTGVSARTIQTWKQRNMPKTGIPARNPAQIQRTPPIQSNAENTQQQTQENTTLDFADSPDPIEKKSIVDSAFASLKGMLGISDRDTPKAPLVFSAKLNEKQQRFVNAVSPTLALGFMTVAAWMWGRIDPEYGVLAPDENVAMQIVEPLLRIYARHSEFLADINPDVADVGASMFALVGYINVSLKLYQQIKQEREEDEYGQENGFRIHRRRDYRRTANPPENGTGNESRRHADVHGTNGSNDQLNGNNGRHTTGVNQSTLTDKEARQHAALSRLSQLDFEHRARRSMRAS